MILEIILPVLLILSLALLVTASRVSRYTDALKKSLSQVNLLHRFIEELPPCEIGNLTAIDGKVKELKEENLAHSWKRFHQDSSILMGGQVTPEPQGYFNYEELYSVPRGEKNLTALWFTLIVFSGLAFCLPAATGAFLESDKSLLLYGIGVGLAACGLVYVIMLIFYTLYARTRTRAMIEIQKLVRSLSAALPVASTASQTGLLLEGTRQNTKNFEKMAEDIRITIENFALEGITPRVTEAFDTSLKDHLAPSINRMEENWYRLSEIVVKKQDENMQILADAFSAKLATSVEDKIRAMNENMDRVNRAMQEIQEGMKLSVNTLYTSLESDRQTMADTAQQVRQAAETQKEAAEHMRTLSLHLENTEKLVGTLTEWDGLIERSADQISEALKTAVVSNEETAKRLAATMESLANAGTEQYEKAAEAAAKLLNDVVNEMNKAMDGVGHEIAESINRASADSVEIIDRLAEKTTLLKEEYDKYFERVEKMNQSNLDEMDFHMQNVISHFSEEATGIMGKLEGNISRAMELFEGNTTNMLASLDEQSRSIGLYAHDLNIDIGELSKNLRESVQLFTDQLHTGVERTFQDFDGGLTEVSRRLANTVESIRESVENLPKALKHE